MRLSVEPGPARVSSRHQPEIVVMEKQCLSAANVLPARDRETLKVSRIVNLLRDLEPATRLERVTC